MTESGKGQRKGQRIFGSLSNREFFEKYAHQIGVDSDEEYYEERRRQHGDEGEWTDGD